MEYNNYKPSGGGKTAGESEVIKMYTLMRCNRVKIEHEIVLDLYDHKTEKGVELHYNLYSKKLAAILIDLLPKLTFKTLDLNSWDILIQQFITHDWE